MDADSQPGPDSRSPQELPRASSSEPAPQTDSRGSDFEAAAGNQEVSLAREFWDFLRENKKWWLTPIIVVIGLLTLVAVLSVSPAAPFIYTLF
jgi:hypothetical protein